MQETSVWVCEVLLI